MKAKKYLEQIETLDIKIRQLEDELAGLRETAGGAAAIRYDKLNVQVSVMADAVERNVIHLIELEDTIFVTKMRMAKLKAHIVSQIQALDDNRYMNILYMRYVQLKKFSYISDKLGYDYDYIRALHGEALGYFESIYADELNFTHNHT